MHILLLAPANSAHLRPLRSVAVHAVHLHSSCKLILHLQTAHSTCVLEMHPRAMFERGSYSFWLPPRVLQCDPATQRVSKSYLGVATLLRCSVHDHAALEDICTQRLRQRGAGFRACTLRKARYHPTHGATAIVGCSIAGAETCNKAFAGLCWCQIPMAGIPWPQQWSDAARQPTAVT